MPRCARVLLLIAALVGAVLPTGLSGTAYAAACQTLNATDVAYGAPVIAATLDAGAPSACYDLDLAKGTTILLGPRSGTARVRVFSGATELRCDARTPCRLQDAGRQRIVVDTNGARQATVDLRVLALTTDSGCPEVPESELGAPDQTFSVGVEGNDVTCRSVQRGAGLHLLHEVNDLDIGLATSQVAPDGTLSCIANGPVDEGTTPCRATSPGTFLIGLGDQLGPLPDHFVRTHVLQSVDLEHPVSCPVVSPSWRATPAVVSDAEPNVVCHDVADAERGDRLVATTAPYKSSYPISGSLVTGGCERPTETELGCTLTGDGPFHVVSWGRGPYQVVTRRVDPGSDCPVAPVLAFGTLPSDVHPGIGCRRVPVPAGHPFALSSIGRNDTQYADRVTVYDSSYQAVCNFPNAGSNDEPTPCTLDRPGGVIVIADLLAADTRTFVYDEASTRGCTTPPHLRRTHVTDLVPLELACELVGRPAGSVVTTYLRSGDRLDATNEYLDATGTEACTLVSPSSSSCRLTGTGPFRLLLHSYTPHLYTTTLDADVLNACPTVLEPGPANLRELVFSTATSARCLRLTPVRPGTTELIHAYRPRGTGPLTAKLHDRDGVEVAQTFSYDEPLNFSPNQVGDPSTLVVLGTPGPVRVARAEVDEPGEIVNWRRPHVLGDARPGHFVVPGYGQWSNEVGALHPIEHTWLLDGSAVSHEDIYRVPPDAAGKQLVLQVTAHEDTHFQVRTVDSAPVTVAAR